ncbi:MAG TPA: ANTAR domain-containing protein [Burkholderiales bacterium]|jgi:response regulator NasT|nr:ANTAR domain-containing protein [Burkholderiales bacterium]
MLKVMIVDEAVERTEVLQQALARAGYEVIAYVPSTFDLHRQVAALKPDIVIIDTDSPDRDTLENLCVVTRDDPRPVVMFTHDGDSEKIRAATQAGVSAYVVDGMSGDRIGPIIDAAVARFEQFQALKRELDDIEGKLADRKVIEKAKGILMQSRNLSEDEAYRALRKQAMESNLRLAEVSRQLISVAGLMG